MWVDLGKYHTGGNAFYECAYDLESFTANAFGPFPHQKADPKTVAYSVKASTEDDARTWLSDMIGPGTWD